MNNLKIYIFALVLSLLIHCTLFLSAPELKDSSIKNFSHRIDRSKFKVLLEYREKTKKKLISRSNKKVKKPLEQKKKKLEKKSDLRKDNQNLGDDSEMTKYLAAVRDKINEHKFISRVARKLNLKGEVHFTFNIHKPNKIQDLRIRKSSGFKALDRSALQSINSIEDSTPVIPSSLKLDVLEIKGILVYD